MSTLEKVWLVDWLDFLVLYDLIKGDDKMIMWYAIIIIIKDFVKEGGWDGWREDVSLHGGDTVVRVETWEVWHPKVSPYEQTKWEAEQLFFFRAHVNVIQIMKKLFPSLVSVY